MSEISVEGLRILPSPCTSFFLVSGHSLLLATGSYCAGKSAALGVVAASVKVWR